MASSTGEEAAPGRLASPEASSGNMMLQTVRDACQFDPQAINYALSDQVEALEDLVGHDTDKARAFFDKTYVTGGMQTLLRQGLQRLASPCLPSSVRKQSTLLARRRSCPRSRHRISSGRRTLARTRRSLLKTRREAA